jgi:hypothetical protein
MIVNNEFKIAWKKPWPKFKLLFRDFRFELHTVLIHKDIVTCLVCLDAVRIGNWFIHNPQVVTTINS